MGLPTLTPGQAATPAPIFLAQGADDERVTPAVTRALVGRLCRLGDTVELRTYRGTSATSTWSRPPAATWRRGSVTT